MKYMKFFNPLLMVQFCTLKATPDEIPVGTYPDVDGVVSAAAKTDIDAGFASLLTLIPNTNHPDAQNDPPEGVAPEYDRWHPALASQMRAEVEALQAKIDAAAES